MSGQKLDIPCTIVMPNGSKQSVPNPLFTYHFHPIDPGFAETPYDRWNRTLRYPTSDGPNAKTDVKRMKAYVPSSIRPFSSTDL